MPDKAKYGTVLDFSTQDQTDAEKLADDYITLRGKDTPKDFNKDDWKDKTKWYANKKVLFLNRLLDKKRQLNVKVIEKLDQDLGLAAEKNPELLQRWFPLAI